MSEDKKTAEQLAIDDIRAASRSLHDLGMPQQVFSFEHGIPAGLPEGDGEGVFMPFVIGMRGRLSKTEARKAARMWEQVIARYPKAIVYPHLIGYDQDPREIWEIVDAARYVRWFARAAGLDDIDTAIRLLGPDSPGGQVSTLVGAIGFLAACGVFGEDAKRDALRNLKPTLKQ